MSLTIRPILPDDAESIERLYGQSAAHLRSVGDQTDFRFNAESYRRDGFGSPPAFSGVIAIVDGAPAGYLLYTVGYDTDRAIRDLFMIDLAVDERLRGRGIGTALMERAAAICRDAGGAQLFWAVYAGNQSALTFYRRLGAEPIRDVLFMRLPVQAS
jgi:ribosomal protein S18 acetylase RimI-like enzyme